MGEENSKLHTHMHARTPPPPPPPPFRMDLMLPLWIVVIPEVYVLCLPEPKIVSSIITVSLTTVNRLLCASETETESVSSCCVNNTHTHTHTHTPPPPPTTITTTLRTVWLKIFLQIIDIVIHRYCALKHIHNHNNELAWHLAAQILLLHLRSCSDKMIVFNTVN